MKCPTHSAAFAALAISTLTSLAAAQGCGAPKPPECECYTHTSSISRLYCPPPASTLCIRPLCLMYTTTTLPGVDPSCSTTPTVTETIPCPTRCPVGCATNTITETGPRTCIQPTRSSTISPTPTQTAGGIGEQCGRFYFPGDPPCAPGLTCVLENPMLPDLGGECQPTPPTSITTSPTAYPTVGAEGDPCLRFRPWPGDPPCGTGLRCILTDPRVPDIGGTCERFGEEGDRCGTFAPPGEEDLPCGPGLMCVLDDPMIPDAGGSCEGYGAEGDRCGTFAMLGEEDPLCGPELTCVLDDPMIPDAGGVCRPALTTTSPPQPTRTVGLEGDRCDVYTVPLLPPCDEGLYCQHTSTEITDIGGYCREIVSSSTAAP